MAHPIPISFRIIDDCEILMGFCKAKSRTTCSTLKDCIPLINELYSQCNIKFQIKECRYTNADKCEINKYDPDSVQNLFEKKPLHEAAINVFIVPIIPGRNINAYHLEDSSINNTFIVCGERDPYSCELFSKYELAKILAHEIGHELGIARHSPDENSLMSRTAPHGTSLSPQLIEKIRRTANIKYGVDTKESYSKKKVRDINPETRKVKYNCQEGCCSKV